MNEFNTTFQLSNGISIPSIGFGTWQTPDGETAVKAVTAALKKGYRHIDTAAIYQNEESVGRAIQNSGLSQQDIFVTSKLWNNARGYKKTMAAFEETLNRLALDVLDLYLVHWPAKDGHTKEWQELNLSTWRAMEELYQKGKIRAIGVSNFLVHHLHPLMEQAEIQPMVNQIEFHPGYMQEEVVQFCKEHQILVEAWSPLGTGKMLNHETLKKLAAKYQKSVAQLCIRWCLQNGTLPLPKSVTPERIIENIQVFDFEITADDMNTINDMAYFGGSGLHPDHVNF